MKRVRIFFGLPPRTMLMLAEAFFYLGWARCLVYLPFARVAPTLGVRMRETTDTPRESDNQVLKNVYDAIRIMSTHTFWDSKCLVKAIAGLKMLERRLIDSTLYLGTAKDESGKMIAHAWLRSGPYYITGSEGMEKFSVVGKFAKHASGSGS